MRLAASSSNVASAAEIALLSVLLFPQSALTPLQPKRP
jgi:hypothetical protein